VAWRRGASAVASVATAALALAACGGGGSSSTTPATVASTPPKAPKPTKGDDASGGGAPAKKGKAYEQHREQVPTGGATPAQVRKSFPAPQADPEVEGSAEAIAAGESACAGKMPAQIKTAFYDEAVEEGTLVPSSPEGKMIARLGTLEKQAGGGASFATGQLAADTYAATLPEKTARYGFGGCAHALAAARAAELEASK
jgi:hypothetical protein